MSADLISSLYRASAELTTAKFLVNSTKLDWGGDLTETEVSIEAKKKLVGADDAITNAMKRVEKVRKALEGEM